MSETRPALIAIVDDEEAVCKALQRLMRSAGFAAETFNSGADFLDSLRTRLPHCVILDLHMPGTNGFDVLNRLASEGVPVPAIVVTGNDTDDAGARALASGAVAYLRKPVDDRTLLDALTFLKNRDRRATT
ncbi:response regulator [Methylococcus sp. ANG]|uniref:response regulator transcription factor n=1 Tax=Methylococcus sp. ANG TaxID=3231903 RepID=UPI00345A0B8C